MKSVLFVVGMFVGAGATLLSLSCTPQKPVGGVVVRPEKIPVGSYVPDISFKSANGQQTTLNKVRQPITILCFTFSPGAVCCRLEPALVEASNRLRSVPVSVVQVSLPTSKCPHGAGCTQACDIDQGRLIVLCDSDHIAWKAFGRPDPNTVYLISENGEVIDMGTIGALGPLVDKAEQIGREIEAHSKGN